MMFLIPTLLTLLICRIAEGSQEYYREQEIYSNGENSSWSSYNAGADAPHSRPKRLLYYSGDRRLTLPPGSAFFLTPTLELPVIRNMPAGYATSMTISIPFALDFLKLGWISEDHPYGAYPDLSSGGEVLSRRKRDPAEPKYGTTAHMYGVFEDILSNLGYPGGKCMHRAVCEMRAGPLAENYGWLADILEWILTPSENTKDKQNLDSYFEAERRGRKMDCSAYSECSFSIFSSMSNKRRKNKKDTHKYAKEESIASNFIENDEERIPDRDTPFIKTKFHEQSLTTDALMDEIHKRQTIQTIQELAMQAAFNKIFR